jgi:hypothetical protein
MKKGLIFLTMLLGSLLYSSQASELPKTISIKKSVELTVYHQGKAVGTMTLPAGRKVEVKSRDNDWLIIQSGAAEGKILIQETDFEMQLANATTPLASQKNETKIVSAPYSPHLITWKVNRPLAQENINQVITTLYQGSNGPAILQECVSALWSDAITASSYPGWTEHLRLAQGMKLWLSVNDIASILDQQTATQLFANKFLIGSLGETISPADKPKAVWKILADLQKTFPDQIENYHALAVALAVVHDETFPTNWPDSQAGLIPRKNNNWIDLFRYFTEQDQKGRLLLTLTELKADQLKFVVDAPVETSELEWANKNVKFSRREFDRSYFFVTYDDARLAQQVYDWPWPEAYTLENIAKRNGICIDQAYFSFLSGKAKGLPTLVFSGAGKSGYHAWFGYMKANDRWEMDAGRYQTDGYAVGQAIDPQTRLPINDHELEAISSHITSTPAYQQSQNLLLLTDLAASLNPSLLNSQSGNESISYKNLLQKTLKICPANTHVWLRLAQWLETHGTIKEQQSHYAGMIEQFKNQKDLKAWAQERLSRIVRDSGDIAAAETLQKQIMNDNRRDRTDLGVAAAAQLLQQKIKNGEYEPALTEFCRVVKSYKKDGGGALFFELVDPFVRDMHNKGQNEIAKKALQFAHNTMEFGRDPTSQVQQGFEALHDLLKIKMKGR